MSLVNGNKSREWSLHNHEGQMAPVSMREQQAVPDVSCGQENVRDKTRHWPPRLGSQLNLDLNSGFESYQLCDLETDQTSLVKPVVSLTYKGTTLDKVRM